MKYFNYDANQHSIDRMIQVERQKINHYKMLNTIYKKKSNSLLKQERDVDKDRFLRFNNQLLDKQRRWKQAQKQINFQNSVLRNKLLHIYIPKEKDTNQIIKTNQSFDTIFKDKQITLQKNQEYSQSRSKAFYSVMNGSQSNSKKVQNERQLAQTNARFFNKLSNIQSDIMPKLKLYKHNKQSTYLKQMVLKKSPKRNIRMKKFIEKTISQRSNLINPSTKSFKQFINYRLIINPEETFVFN